MNTQQFLSLVLPSVGYWASALFMPDGKLVHRFFNAGDAAGLLGLSNWAVQKGANVYFGVAGYVPQQSDGELRRTAACALFHRSLRLDIDCGPGKPYPTKRDGWQALVSFMQAAGLPEPTIVDSGGGLHVYWPLTEDLPQDKWLPLAGGLKQACERHHFAADPVVTMDAARILRLPGTPNLKTGTPRPVQVLHLGPAHDPATLAPRLPYAGPVLTPGHARAGVNDELASGRYPGYVLRDVLVGCPGMRAMLETGGSGVSEPLWKAALDLVNKSDDSHDVKSRVAHAISEGHPSYSPGVLAQKWAQVQQQDYHPPTCAKMAGLGMSACGTCPMRAAIKSPVSLTRVAAASLNVQPTPAPPPAQVPQPVHTGTAPAQPVYQQHGVFMLGPTPEIRVIDGLLTAKLSIRDGVPHQLVPIKVDDEVKDTWVPIIPYKLTGVERLLEASGRQMIVNLTFDAFTDAARRVTLTNAILHDGKAFAQTMAGAGLSLNSVQSKQLQDKFMPEFLTQLQRLRAANTIAARCGWTDDHSGFVLGTRLFTGKGVEQIHAMHDSAAAAEMQGYHEQGDEARSTAAIALAMAGSPERQAVVALSIATPLMEFTGVDGVILNAWSPESGVGKSTLCNAALAVWGNPDKLRKDYRDTANATWKLASTIGNLPMVVDEFTNVDGKSLSDYVYTATQGREKHRLNSSAQLNAGSNRWRLAMITTANNSIHEKLLNYRSDATAEAARVFELRLSPLSMSPAALSDAKLKLMELREHFGHLGAKLVQLYLSRDVAYWTKAVNGRIAWWDQHVATGTSDRFRSACAALIELGAVIGQAMGLPFDVDAVKAVVQEQWRRQAREFEEVRRSPEDFVVSYMTEHLGDFAIIGGISGNDLLTQGSRRYLGEIRGQTINGKFIRSVVNIPLDPLREYVIKQNGNFKSLQEWMKQDMDQNGIVQFLGRRTFMAGQVQAMRTPLVTFRAGILGQLQSVDLEAVVDAKAAAR
jgi:hypothetical protein